LSPAFLPGNHGRFDIMRIASILLACSTACTAAAWTAAAVGADDRRQDFFEARVRPIFVEHCYECHAAGAKRIEGGLRLDTATGLSAGGESGPLVSPGEPEASFLIDCVSYSPDGVNMPPAGKLSDRAIADLRTWVRDGAWMPPTTAESTPPPRKETVIDAAARDFWSFRPLAVHDVPPVAEAAWPQRKLDHFVLAALEANGLQPSPEADRRTLIRRLSFDLLGLPPTHDEVAAFESNDDPAAYAALVERMLDSPHYGERWARHWLDVARYGEDNPTSEATCKAPRFPFRYRDWVVQALNDDLPYDEFIRRQVAADLRPDLPPSERAATGFLGLSPVYHKEPKLSAEAIAVIVADEWDERIDMLTRGVLGLTVACARCHDHKFDPIRSADYYALAGVMAGTRLVESPLTKTSAKAAKLLQDTPEELVDVQLRLSYAKAMRKTAEVAKQPTAEFEARIEELTAAVQAVKDRKLFDGDVANAVCDASVWIDGSDPAWTSLVYRPGVPRDLPVFIRGNPARPGEIVPRRFIEVLSRGKPQPFKHGSGRRELAEALVDDAAPLAARVIVNRVWGWHFGRPLVRTPSNFGALGDRPSHPELLDDLASRFVAAGWSLKWLHREIVLSAAYRQASVHPQAGTPDDPALVDGDNRLLWRMNRRRLEPEAWRDAVLAAAGRLNLAMGGESVDLDDAENVRRTIYGKVSRQNAADVLRLFDFPDAKQHAEERLATTTPLQQLYLLNSPFVQRNAAAMAEAGASQPADVRLRELFRRILQRDPTAAETAAAEHVLEARSTDVANAWRLLAHGLLAGNEFLYVD